MWLWILAAIVAFFVKGLCGFANTLVFTSILGFGANNINISPVELVLGYPSNLIIAWRNRRSLDPKIYIPLTILIIAGSIPGAFILKNINAQYVKIIFGIVIIFIAVEMYFRERSAKKTKGSKIILAIIGIISGALCGLFGIGALLAAYIGRVTDNSSEFKANICAVFSIENTFRIILYSIMGIITLPTLYQSLIMIPFMLLGLWLGIKSSQILDEKYVKKLVIVLLMISGVVLIFKNI